MNYSHRYFARVFAPLFLLFTLVVGGLHRHAPVMHFAHHVGATAQIAPVTDAAEPASCSLCALADESHTLSPVTTGIVRVFVPVVFSAFSAPALADGVVAAPRRAGRAPPVFAPAAFIATVP